MKQTHLTVKNNQPASAQFSTQRQIVLANREATEWLAQRNWHAGATPRPFQILGDEVSTPTLTLRRFATSPLNGMLGNRFGKQSPENTIEVSLVVEGRLILSAPGMPPLDAGEGSFFARRGDCVYDIETNRPFAVMQLVVSAEHLRASLPSANNSSTTLARLLEVSPVVRATFTALSTSLLNADISADDPGFPWLTRALEQLFFAIIEGSTDAEPLRSATEREHYARARRYIQANASNPDLDAALLAKEIGLSRSYVQRIFRQMGDTPMNYLRRLRVVQAQQLLRIGDGSVRPDYTAIARACGFRSLRALRDAMAKHANAQTETDCVQNEPDCVAA